MNKSLVILLCLIGNVCAMAQTFPYIRDWGTYYGNKNNIVQDAIVDSYGNIYIASNIGDNATTDNANYATPNAHQTTYGGEGDAFISKFSPEGTLVWATYYGGELDDKVNQIVIDGDDNIYIVGKTSSQTNIVTPNAFQTTMVSGNGNLTAGYFAKFSSDGELLYGTYYDGEMDDQVFAIEVSESYVYAYGKTNSTTNIATPNSFQPSFTGTSPNQTAFFLVKFSLSGERLWATYYGHEFEGDNDILLPIGGIGIDEDDNTYISGFTDEHSGYYASSNNVFLPQNPGAVSTFITKFDSGGNRVWSTYFGGTSVDIGINLRLHNNHLYMCGYSYSQGIAIGSVHQTQRMGIGDDFLLKMDLDGQPVWATYFGGADGVTGNRTYISFGDNDSVWLAGLTNDTEGIATVGAYQTSLNMGTGTQYNDAYFARFNNTGRLDFASYYGGENLEYWGTKVLKALNDEFYIVGSSSSLNGIATQGALQETVISDNFEGSFKTLFIGKFKLKDDLGINSFNTNTYNLWPNPSSGVVTLTSAKDTYFSLNCYDVHGRLVKSKHNLLTNTPIDLHNLSSGIYFLEVTSKSNIKQIFKVIFE